MVLEVALRWSCAAEFCAYRPARFAFELRACRVEFRLALVRLSRCVACWLYLAMHLAYSRARPTLMIDPGMILQAGAVTRVAVAAGLPVSAQD